MRLFKELTEREEEVLVYLSMGQSNPQIASQLSISTHTVHNHTKSIFKKLNVRGRGPASLLYWQKKTTT
ncbi:MAG: response regulator transcription factor [Chloroflexi bacterium AL-W]|nr:response regulator transcription factor [Chloroflexi bacterium AL-N1]NOK65040.1 response regulator transcription factor [Chloroflexi bacterium AL-N10]NOK72693.1 response regulator transcription factor [Chloroflexi bacterium AL-N5]NOK79219.1 response regulator transcription factor [Chloroflexi bacterium AL-W]NOK87135.1 response regulator transcription factor [Chloroflexi bacterium AL-N15]